MVLYSNIYSGSIIFNNFQLLMVFTVKEHISYYKSLPFDVPKALNIGVYRLIKSNEKKHRVNNSLYYHYLILC